MTSLPDQIMDELTDAPNTIRGLVYALAGDYENMRRAVRLLERQGLIYAVDAVMCPTAGRPAILYDMRRTPRSR